ncbi:MAG TPA: PQQ-dependent sugar dehydrogenase [Thermoanaerobaculales bacterium]|nr:PQQ-dependent sugar dehydrogenase [Thermoanaerobaculales bacterium]
MYGHPAAPARTSLVLASLVVAAAAAPAAATDPVLSLELVVGGLTNPAIIANAGDGSGRLFIGEQDGLVRIWDGSQLLPTPFLDVTAQSISGGEQGLLGLAFDPGFESNRLLYVHYSAPDTTGDPAVDHFTTISRFTVDAGDPNQVDPASEIVLLRYPQPYGNHNGGTIAFGPDGLLYIGLGDGGSAGDPGDRAQSTSVLLGKILRIDPQGDDLPADPDRNYSIPPDNPFVGAAGEDEIWALGLRNPWRFSFDRSTGDLFVGDVGQNAWEEIDHQPAGSDGGENYGWRCYEGNHPYNTAGCGGPSQYTAPIAEYSHGDGCSVTGGHRYRGASYPNLQGTYLYADYCSGTIWGAAPAGSGWSSAPLLESSMTISCFGQDEAGELYLADHGSNGAVYRIVDSSPTNLVFADGFESGDATAWSGVAPRRAAAGRRPQ